MRSLHRGRRSGILFLEFTPEGNLEFRVEAEDQDYLFDEIGSGLKIRQYQREKKELLESLELFYRVVFRGDKLEDELGKGRVTVYCNSDTPAHLLR